MTKNSGFDVPVIAGGITAERIGGRVLSLRTGHGWSTRLLAERIGIAPTVVSAVEAGLRLPTISLLYRFANALDVAPGELLPGGGELPRVEVHLPIDDGPGSSTAQVIGGGPGNPTQTYLYDLEAGEGDGGFERHPGEELLVVMEGEVVCSVLGGEDVVVGAGGSRLIETHVPHGLRAGASGPARFLLVCTDACQG